jgi:hypothetical protein
MVSKVVGVHALTQKLALKIHAGSRLSNRITPTYINNFLHIDMKI